MANHVVVVVSDDELAIEAERSGFTVSELRAFLAEHPVTQDELAEGARLSRRAHEGREKITRTLSPPGDLRD